MDDQDNTVESQTDCLDIAIIGMNIRVPGAANIEQFWTNLRDGVESITFFTDDELLAAGVAPSTLADPHYVKANGVLADIDQFDAAFFDLTPRDVEVLDPQHRLLLESAWEVLETAGYTAAGVDGRIGVYAGIGLNSYLMNNLGSNPEIIDAVGGWQIGMSNDKDFAPTRISYKLDLTGPSVCINTGCSTSLVAIAMACQSLLNYQCDMVIAGGATIQLPQTTGYWYQAGGVASPDGHCRPFDANAQGTLDANGLGMVVLKRLPEALADGDPIQAVIKGFAINNDGAMKVGYTAPSVDGQADVIIEAHTMADIPANTIGFVEAHGTGTNLGDPVEIAALNLAFRQSSDATGFCALGSLKSNLGHLDTAAGVGSLVKTVLALQHQQIPPTLHFQQPNPKIDFDNSPFYVNHELQSWNPSVTPRRAGVSSFGIGGTNAHIVLEEAPMLTASGASRPSQLLLLSAKTATALAKMTTNLGHYLATHADSCLADIAYTLAAGRKSFDHRRILVAETVADAKLQLTSKNGQDCITNTAADLQQRPVLFMFPGMGSEYMNMALELYQNEPAFKEEIDQCAALAKAQDDFDFFEIWEQSGIQESPRKMAFPIAKSHAPTALFIIEYSLAKCWMNYGIQPQAMLGYSGGEYVAACLAGVLSLENALRLVTVSGQLSADLPTGKMLAISLPEHELQPFLTGNLALAAVNGVNMCLASGPPSEVDALQTRLTSQNIKCSRIPALLAYHSSAMAPIIAPLLALFEKFTLNPPQIPWISSVTGSWITDAEATDPHYYTRQIILQPVRFADSIQTAFKNSEFILLEVGPSQVLFPLTMQHPNRPAEQITLYSLSAPQYGQPELSSMLTTLGKMWAAGVDIDWPAFYARERRHRLNLPTYPFDRQRYWIDAKPLTGQRPASAPQATISKNPEISDWFYLPSWQRMHTVRQSNKTQTDPNRGWLIFIDTALGPLIIQELTNRGDSVITVQRGSTFEQIDGQSYSINAQHPDDYLTLLKSLNSSNTIFNAIIHCWLLTSDTSDTSYINNNHATTADIDNGFFSLLYLGQALGAQSVNSLTITVISNNMHEVTGQEHLCPSKSMALGAIKVIPQEYPGINCRNIDVVLPSAADNWRTTRLLRQIVTELDVPPTQRIIALRGNHCWFHGYQQMILPRSVNMPTPFRENGVYLITGGLGNIGLILAELLATTVHAKLILVGRTPLPEKTQWQHWIATHANDDVTSNKLTTLLKLEKAGASVLTMTGDVANLTSMQAIIATAEATFGRLNGVFHAAGITGDDSSLTIADSTSTTCSNMFASKVDGTLVLAEILRNQPLDFCILFSSLAAPLGGLGFSAYAAANLFMDAFVDQHNQTNPVPWICIGWDHWLVTMDDTPQQQVGSNAAALAMTPAEGFDVIERILALPTPVNQLAVSSGDLQARIKQWIQFDPEPDDDSANPTNQTMHARPNLVNAYTKPGNEIETELVQIWEQILGMHPIGIYDDFFELGGNSLLVRQVISHIRSRFHLEIPLQKLFNEPKISGLAKLITTIRMVTQMQTKSDDLAVEREGGAL